MRNKINCILIIFLFFKANFIFSQVYSSNEEDNLNLKITNDSFYLTVAKSNNVDYCDSLAKGKISKIKGEFFKIKSDIRKLSYDLIFDKDLSYADSTNISIKTQDYSFSQDYLLEFTVYDGIKNKRYFLDNETNIIPAKLKKEDRISLCLFNKGMIVSRDGEEYRGKLYEYVFYDLELVKNSNNISINIDGLNSCYLKEYFIIDEIIIKKKNIVLWNGIKFMKI